MQHRKNSVETIQNCSVHTRTSWNSPQQRNASWQKPCQRSNNLVPVCKVRWNITLCTLYLHLQWRRL